MKHTMLLVIKYINNKLNEICRLEYYKIDVKTCYAFVSSPV